MRDRLETLYESEASDDSKRIEKERFIREHQAEIASRYDELFHTDTYLPYGELEINNAYIDLFVKYTEDLILFSELYDTVGQSLPALISALSVLGRTGQIEDKDARNLARSDPKAYVQTYLIDHRQNMDSYGALSVE